MADTTIVCKSVYVWQCRGIGAACRHSDTYDIALGGHLLPSSSLEIPSMPGAQMTPEIQAHIRKILDLCFRSLRPLMINDEDCDMTLGPAPGVLVCDSTPNDNTDAPAFYPADIRLVILKRKIYRNLYATRALHGRGAPKNCTRA